MTNGGIVEKSRIIEVDPREIVAEEIVFDSRRQRRSTGRAVLEGKNLGTIFSSA